MKKSFIITAVTIVSLMLNACGNDQPTQTPLSDQIATIVAATLSAINTQAPPTEIPGTSTSSSVGSLSINGQLQGILAFIRNDNLWISVNGVESQLTTDAIGLPELWYSNPQLSPDGTKIAYLRHLGYD